LFGIVGHPGSLALHGKFIALHSVVLALIDVIVGATLSHVAVDDAHADTHQLQSVTFTYAVYVNGSVSVCPYVLNVAHHIAVVHVLLLYH
jgi:hypothetical protein